MQPAEIEAHAEHLLAASDTFDLARYCVVGSYTRHDEATRHALRDAYYRIVQGLQRPNETYEHHLLWASPGTGKTFFAQEIARSLPGVRFQELNLAKLSQRSSRRGLTRWSAAATPASASWTRWTAATIPGPTGS